MRTTSTRGASIIDLVRPVLAGEADMVVGDRDVQTIEHFSRLKKRLQRLGSAVVRERFADNGPGCDVGVPRLQPEAALQVQVVSNFTYTLESIIQAGKMLDHGRSRPCTDESTDA